MDSLAGLFNSIGGAGANPLLKALSLGSGILGTVGNIQGNIARNNVLSSEMSQMNKLNNLTSADVTQGITGLEQPLSQNLTNAVGNATQAALAQRGLAQAPGIYATALAQGLAPYQLQEQQMAQNAFFQKLGLPIQARPSPFGPFPETTNTSPIWQSLFNKMYNPSGPPQVPGQSNPSAATTGITVPPNVTPDTIAAGNTDTGSGNPLDWGFNPFMTLALGQNGGFNFADSSSFLPDPNATIGGNLANAGSVVNQ